MEKKFFVQTTPTELFSCEYSHFFLLLEIFHFGFTAAAEATKKN